MRRATEQVRHLRRLEEAIRRSEGQLARLVRLSGQRLETVPGVSTVIAAELPVGRTVGKPSDSVEGFFGMTSQCDKVRTDVLVQSG